MNKSQELITTMNISQNRVENQMMAMKLGIDIPHESLPIKAVKGATTGICLVGGMALCGVTAYTAALLLTSAIPWADIESKAVKVALKGGVIGISTASGVAAGKCVYEMGDDINEIIDLMCDNALGKDVKAALEETDNVKEVMTYDDDGEPDCAEEE